MSELSPLIHSFHPIKHPTEDQRQWQVSVQNADSDYRVPLVIARQNVHGVLPHWATARNQLIVYMLTIQYPDDQGIESIEYVATNWLSWYVSKRLVRKGAIVSYLKVAQLQVTDAVIPGAIYTLKSFDLRQLVYPAGNRISPKGTT